MPTETININAVISDLTEVITQSSHGFVVGNVLRCDNATPNIYVKAQANTEDNSKAVGVVSQVININSFVITYSGRLLSGVPADAQGTVEYLSDTVAGAMTSTAPAIVVRIMEISENAVSGIVNIDWEGSGSGGGVASVSGESVDNTDPINPVVNAWPLAGTGTGLANGTIEVDPAFSSEIIIQDDGVRRTGIRFFPSGWIDVFCLDIATGNEVMLKASNGVQLESVPFGGPSYVIACVPSLLSDAATYPSFTLIGSVRQQLNGLAAPTINDDSSRSYVVNSIWIYDGKLWICTDASAGAAVWVQVSGSSLSLETDGTPNGDQTLLNIAAGAGITVTDNGTGTVTIDNSAPATPAIVYITRVALQALITGSTLDTTVTYAITDALTSTAVMFVWAATTNTLQAAAIDQTNTYFGFYNIVGDTFTQVYKANFTLLPLSQGGTNKNMTAAAGAVAYSDADSLELTAVGTTGQVLTSAGTGAPTWATPVAQDSFIISANTNIVTTAAGSTIYFTVFGTNANNLITTENQRQIASPIAFTMSKFYITTLTSQPGTGSLVLTMRKNGSSQSLTVTIAAGAAAGVFSDTSNSFSVAAGDLLTLQVVNNASSASAQLVGWTAVGTR